jgi:YbbR domain-containing protein
MGRQWLGTATSLALALVLALAMWFASTESQRPIEVVSPYPSTGALPIQLTGQGPTRAPYDPTVRQTTLTLRGFASGISSLDAQKDFRVFADLAPAPADARTYTAKVKVQCGRCARLGVRVQAVADMTVEVHLGRLVTETRSVYVEWPGTAAAGLVITHQSATPAQVQLRGADVAVGRVERLVAVTQEPLQAQGVIRFTDVPVMPLDANGQRVQDVTVTPDHVDAELAASRRGIEVPVQPELEGVEAQGYYITGVSIAPQQVQLDGPAAALSEIEATGSLRVPVNITGASSDVVRQVSLSNVLPEGVSAINAPDGVTVTVKLTPLPGTRTFAAQVQWRNLSEGLVVDSVSPEQVDVLISGPQNNLGALQAQDLNVYVELHGLGVGRHTVRVQVDAPTGYLPRSITPDTVEVVVAAVGVPTPTLVPQR